MRVCTVVIETAKVVAQMREALQRHLEQLERLRQKGASEATIRDVFLQFLRDAFPQISVAEPIELEKHVPALRAQGGFADAPEIWQRLPERNDSKICRPLSTCQRICQRTNSTQPLMLCWNRPLVRAMHETGLRLIG